MLTNLAYCSKSLFKIIKRHQIVYLKLKQILDKIHIQDQFLIVEDDGNLITSTPSGGFSEVARLTQGYQIGTSLVTNIPGLER